MDAGTLAEHVDPWPYGHEAVHPPVRPSEGLGVFRALLLTFGFYLLTAAAAWGVWQVIQHLRGH
jgi:hypothetical protein